MKTHENSQDIAGPMSYQNWIAASAGTRRLSISEVPLYSDADITGEISSGLGPYALRNALPNDERDPAIILIVNGYIDPNQVPRTIKTNVSNFTGASLPDEIAALCSLALGVRMMAGGVTRMASDGSPHGFIILGDRERPAFFGKRGASPKILPRVVETVALVPGLLSRFPLLTPTAASTLVRAARSYRDGLWIAEAEPELSWLLLVSALEIAAVQDNVHRTSPVDILRTSKPELVVQLEEAGAKILELVASALARELRATGRFLDFMSKFMPPPPEKRPPNGFRFDWSDRAMRVAMKKVYDHRSSALHEGIPFPPPMCWAPMRDAGWPAPMETIMGLAASTTGGSWIRADMPFSLHIFEQVARGALLNWWAALAGPGADANRLDEPPHTV